MAKKKEDPFEQNFLNKLIDESGSDYASLMEEETLSTATEYIDTGSYALNALITGDVNKGIPNNKVVAFAGEESTGKTYLCVDSIKNAIDMGYIICYFDSENAVGKIELAERGVDIKKVLYYPVSTVQEFRSQAVKIVDAYNKTSNKKRPKLFFVLDSLGNLSTTKEMSDVEDDKDKVDMTRPKIIKSVFRVLSLKMAKAKIPMLVTNHIYSSMDGYVQVKQMGGGCLTQKENVKLDGDVVKSIKDVKVGDKVLTMFGPKDVLNTFHYNKKTIKFTLENGRELECSEEHKFLTENNGELIWKKASDLEENDEILKF